MRITVNLLKTEYEELSRVAQTERRPLRDQAAVLIAESLWRRDQSIHAETQPPEAIHA